MNSEQFNRIIGLAERFVLAYEADCARKQDEWLKVQEEVERRKEILATLRKLAPGEDIPDNAEIVDLGSIFGDEDEEDDDEGSGS